MTPQVVQHTFSPDGQHLYTFYTEGEKKNPTLILLTGFTGTHGDILDFSKHFKDKYFVIIPELPGWGNSPKGTYHLTIEGYAKFIADILKYLSLDKKIYLAGHCMGSAVAIAFTTLHEDKVKELFLVSAPYLHGMKSEEMFAHLANASEKVPQFLKPFFFFFRSRFFAIPLGFFVIQTKSLKKKLSLIFLNSIKQQFQDEQTVENNWNSLVLFDYKKLQKLSIPIHIFHGEKDILVLPVQAEKLAKLCKNVTVDIIPNAGHMPPVETPGKLAMLFEKYLS